MKRGKKMLLLLAVLAVIIVAALLIPGMFSEAEEETQNTVGVFSVDSSAITELAWTYGEETLHFVKEEGEWYYADDKAFPADSSLVSTLAQSLSMVEATKTLDQPGASEEYGLDNPACTITVTTGNTSTQLQFGNQATVGTQRYFSTGDGKVYLVEKTLYSSFQCGLYDLVQFETLPAMETVTALEVNTDTTTLHIKYRSNSEGSYAWIAQGEDGDVVLDTELTQTFLADILSLTWASCVNYKADDQELESYGLVQPAVTAAIHYTQTVNGQTQAGVFQVEFGSLSDSQYYARIADSEMVYLVEAELVETLLYTTTDQLRSEEVLTD